MVRPGPVKCKEPDELVTGAGPGGPLVRHGGGFAPPRRRLVTREPDFAGDDRTLDGHDPGLPARSLVPGTQGPGSPGFRRQVEARGPGLVRPGRRLVRQPAGVDVSVRAAESQGAGPSQPSRALDGQAREVQPTNPALETQEAGFQPDHRDIDSHEARDPRNGQGLALARPRPCSRHPEKPEHGRLTSGNAFAAPCRAPRPVPDRLPPGAQQAEPAATDLRAPRAGVKLTPRFSGDPPLHGVPETPRRGNEPRESAA